MLEVQIKHASEADASRLSVFSASTYAAAFGPSFQPGDLVAHLDANLSAARWREYLGHDRVLLAEDGEELVGFLQFGRAAGDDMEIHRVYVAQDRLGRGIGSRLIAAALDLPELSAALSVRIEVWQQNVGARRLYERFGFTATGERGPDFVTASGERSPGDLILVRRPPR